MRKTKPVALSRKKTWEGGSAGNVCFEAQGRTCVHSLVGGGHGGQVWWQSNCPGDGQSQVDLRAHWSAQPRVLGEF